MYFSGNANTWSIWIRDPVTGILTETVMHSSSPRPVPANAHFGPVPATQRSLAAQPDMAPKGTRYCEEMGAFVPAQLPFSVRAIVQHKQPLTKRIFTRQFWSPEDEDAVRERAVVISSGLTHANVNLIPLKEAQNSPWIKYHGV